MGQRLLHPPKFQRGRGGEVERQCVVGHGLDQATAEELHEGIVEGLVLRVLIHSHRINLRRHVETKAVNEGEAKAVPIRHRPHRHRLRHLPPRAAAVDQLTAVRAAGIAASLICS